MQSFPSVCRLRPHRILVPEEQGDAPQSSQTHQCVDDPADHTGGAAAEKGHQVELEEPDRPQLIPPMTVRISAILSNIGKTSL